MNAENSQDLVEQLSVLVEDLIDLTLEWRSKDCAWQDPQARFNELRGRAKALGTRSRHPHEEEYTWKMEDGSLCTTRAATAWLAAKKAQAETGKKPCYMIVLEGHTNVPIDLDRKA